MPGEDKQTQTQTQQQNSKTAPWEVAQPLLQDLISKYSGLNTGVTGGQSSALSSLMGATSNLPNFASQGAGALSNLFGSSTQPQIGMLTQGLAGLDSNIGATARGANLNPMSTPGFSDALTTSMNDITNRVKGVYAGSGRDPSGAGSFSKALGRGLTEGTAPTIAAEAGRLRGEQQTAANTLYGAGNTTAGAITGQQQVPLANQSQALGLIPQLMQAFTAPAQTQLGAANTQFSQPFANLQALLAPSMGLGGLGSQSSGTATGTSTTVQPQSTLGNIMGGLAGGAGILSSMGGAGGGMAALAPLLALSDIRAKDDVETIGKLNDGQNVVRFRYRGQPKVHIGLLAQDVAEVEPDAVYDVGAGLLAIDQGRATDRAAEIGKAAA